MKKVAQNAELKIVKINDIIPLPIDLNILQVITVNGKNIIKKLKIFRLLIIFILKAEFAGANNVDIGPANINKQAHIIIEDINSNLSP